MTKRALLIVPDYAYTPKTGGGQRSALFFEALSRQYQVDVLVVAEYVRPGYFDDKYGANGFRQVNVAPAGAHGLWKHLRPFNRQAIDRISAAVASRKSWYAPDMSNVIDYSEYDVVVARYLRSAARAGALEADVPLLIDIDDRDDYVVKKRVSEAGVNPFVRLLLKRRHHQLTELFPAYIKRADHLWFVAEADHAGLVHSSVSVLPNIPFAKPDNAPLPPAPAENMTLLFVGSAEHRPNHKGIVRFIQHSWPRILKNLPEARLRVVGSGQWRKQTTLFETAKNVDFIGQVDDLTPEYACANVAISPVFEGGGSKIKVIEAFAYNRAVVAACHSLRGLDALTDIILAADDDVELAQLCIDLLRSPERAAALAAKGREIVAQTYNRDVFAKSVIDACVKISGGSEPS